MPIEEYDVIEMVMCPDQEIMVDCSDCTGCDYYHGMGDNNFTLKCGFPDIKSSEECGEKEGV